MNESVSSRRPSLSQPQLTHDSSRRDSSPKVPEISLQTSSTDPKDHDREINVTTALRLIREVSKARSKQSLDAKKKRYLN
jgi:hypothetical protein